MFEFWDKIVKWWSGGGYPPLLFYGETWHKKKTYLENLVLN